MATQRITFTEWTPDQPSIVENLSIAKNVVAGGGVSVSLQNWAELR